MLVFHKLSDVPLSVELILPLTKNQPEGGFFTSNPILFGLTCFVISTHNYLLVYFTRVSIVLQ